MSLTSYRAAPPRWFGVPSHLAVWDPHLVSLCVHVFVCFRGRELVAGGDDASASRWRDNARALRGRGLEDLAATYSPAS